MITGQQRLLQIVVDTAELTWMDDALCAQIGSDFWFPEKGEPVTEAKRICEGCPVRVPCLEYALEIGDKFGIWGGKSERQRRTIRTERNAA